jgi:hypothetical protein
MKQLASHIRNTRLSQIQAEDNEAPGLDELGIQMEPTPQRQGPVPTYQPQNAYNPYDMRNQQNHMNTAKIVSPGPQQQPYQQKQNITQPVVNPQQNFAQKQQNVTQPYPGQNIQQKPVQDAKNTQQQPQNQNQNQKPYQQPQQHPQPQQKPQQPQPQQPHQQKPQPQPQPQPKPNPTNESLTTQTTTTNPTSPTTSSSACPKQSLPKQEKSQS